MKQTCHPLTLLALISLQAGAICLFSKGFLLLRTELSQRSSAAGQQLWWQKATTGDGQHPFNGTNALAYDKVVVLLIDALRYDFVFAPLDRSLQGSNSDAYPRMPETLRLLGDAGKAGIAVKFVADTPTITISRLKAIMTGSLPTFLDIGESFAAASISEDNLLSQMHAAGKRVVVFGDDTWQQLKPRDMNYSAIHPYPSFNVRDLHTVDNGVDEHMRRYLGSPSGWDVVVGHYLGVDHAGHSHGVLSAQMVDKVTQMDQQVEIFAGMLLDGAAPGGPYARTLLLVAGDHGQGLRGDHGGGSAEETDSVMLAWDMGAWWQQRRRRRHQRADANAASDRDASNSEGGGSAAAAGGGGGRNMGAGVGAADAVAIRAVCSTGRGGNEAGADHDHAPALGNIGTLCAALDQDVSPAQGVGPHPGFTSAIAAMPQIDLTPTLALLLGLPIPYSNLGKADALLWRLAHRSGGGSSGDEHASGDAHVSGVSWLASYTRALHVNAMQVQRYLHAYAAAVGLPRRELAACDALLHAAQQQQQQQQQHDHHDHDHASQLHVAASYLRYLSEAAELARRKFSRFNVPYMAAGCAALLAAVAAFVWQLARMCEARRCLACCAACVTLSGAGLAHGMGLFSVSWIMGEGRITAHTVAATACLLLAKAAYHAAALPPCAVSNGDSSNSNSRRRRGWLARAGQMVRVMCQLAWLVVLAGVVLGTAWGLAQVGLIDRSHADPHDKSTPDFQLQGPSYDEVVSSSSGSGIAGGGADSASSASGSSGGADVWRAWSAALRSAWTAGLGAALLRTQMPLLALALLLSWLRVRLVGTRRQRRRHPAGGIVCGLHHAFIAVAGRLYWLQLAAVGLYWLAHFFGGRDMTVHAALAAAVQHTAQIPGVGAGQYVTRAAAAALLPVWDAVVSAGALDVARTLSDLLQASGAAQAVASFLALPLRLALPRIAYAPAAAATLYACAVAAWRACTAHCMHPSRSRSRSSPASPGTDHDYDLDQYQDRDWEQDGDPSLELHWAVVSSGVGAMAMLLGYKGPLMACLGTYQAAALLALLAAALPLQLPPPMRSALSQRGPRPSSTRVHKVKARSATNVTTEVEVLTQDADADAVRMRRAYAGGLALALAGGQLFFLSGHFCEFSGLQYDAPFIGWDEMLWAVSPPLMWANTFGAMMLTAAALPLWLGAACRNENAQRRNASDRSSDSDDIVEDGDDENLSQGEGQGQGRGRLLLVALLAYCLLRCVALCCAVLCAAVQMHHIVVWAIFAPKAVFEVCMALSCAATCMLVATLSA